VLARRAFRLRTIGALAPLSPNTATHANRTHTVRVLNVTRVAAPSPNP
jgi:hypothetical protein